MKTRSEVVAFIHNTDPRIAIPNLNLRNRYKGKGEKAAWHYGVCELRQLLDFIYDGPPLSKEEELKGIDIKHKEGVYAKSGE